MTKIFELLATKIHPLVLGTIQRSREQIAFLASNLLRYHIKDDAKIRKIVEIIPRERFSHEYIISRREVKEVLELNIREPEGNLLENITNLFGIYSKMLELDIPYNPETYLSGSEVATSEFNRAIIESEGLTHIFRTIKEIKRIIVPPQLPHIPVPTGGTKKGFYEKVGF
jgi:predicted nucleic acid-binding protein